MFNLIAETQAQAGESGYRAGHPIQKSGQSGYMSGYGHRFQHPIEKSETPGLARYSEQKFGHPFQGLGARDSRLNTRKSGFTHVLASFTFFLNF